MWLGAALRNAILSRLSSSNSGSTKYCLIMDVTFAVTPSMIVCSASGQNKKGKGHVTVA
jgi:hypothetical protein